MQLKAKREEKEHNLVLSVLQKFHEWRKFWWKCVFCVEEASHSQTHKLNVQILKHKQAKTDPMKRQEKMKPNEMDRERDREIEH